MKLKIRRRPHLRDVKIDYAYNDFCPTCKEPPDMLSVEAHGYIPCVGFIHAFKDGLEIAKCRNNHYWIYDDFNEETARERHPRVLALNKRRHCAATGCKESLWAFSDHTIYMDDIGNGRRAADSFIKLGRCFFGHVTIVE